MGKLIVFEGTDGSGKSTQFALLTKRLEAEGTEFRTIVFPQYSEASSALIRMYLGGEFGKSPSDINAYAASTFFAVDRYASYHKVWGEYYKSGGLIVSDRYTTSNAVHQAAKEPPEKREAFFRWLYDLEHVHMELPVPDLVIYLDVPTDITETLMRHREDVTNTRADIHEQNMDYLRLCRQTGLQAASYYGWRIVSCTKDGVLRSIEDIHEEIFRLVMDCVRQSGPDSGSGRHQTKGV